MDTNIWSTNQHSSWDMKPKPDVWNDRQEMFREGYREPPMTMPLPYQNQFPYNNQPQALMNVLPSQPAPPAPSYAPAPSSAPAPFSPQTLSYPPVNGSHSNRNSINSINSLNSLNSNSPRISPNFDSNIEINPFDINLRRHSIGDVYPKASFQPNFLSTEYNNTLELINQYFDVDYHNRVKVTLKFLQERFFNEEKYLSESFQLPKFPIESSLRNYELILVGFKAGRIDVFYKSPNNIQLKNLKVGDLVIVEADRGRDLGKVFKLNISIDEARLLKLLQFQEQQLALNDNDDLLSIKGLHNQPNPPILHSPKSIVSLAQSNELVQILNKKQDEEKACRLCLAKIANSINQSPNLDYLQMKLIDAEYQFDRKKLIFYYSTSKRIDFRDLVRELFRIYKTRIWMCAVNGIPYVPNHFNYTQSQPQSQSQPHPQTNQFDLFKVDRRFSLPFDTPRKLPDLIPTSNVDGGESFVLKSLVDSINH